MKCPVCSQTIRDDAVFCGQCGKKIPRCPTCGTVITKRIRTCPKDGTPLPEDIIALFPAEEKAGFQIHVDSTVDSHIRVEDTAGSQIRVEDIADSQVHLENPANSQVHVENASDPHTSMEDTDNGTIPAKTFSPDISFSDVGTASGTKKKRQPRWLVIAAAAVVCIIGYNILSGRSSQPAPQKENTVGNTPEENRPTAAAAEATSIQTTEQGYTETPAKDTEPSTEPPSGEIIHTYEIIAADITWQEAKKDCEARGGHLATITSMEEYETIVSLLMDSDLYYLWLGASLHSGYDEWEDNSWITGEEWTLPSSLWYPGEPSKEDLDGTKEYYLCLWNAKYDEQDIGWTLNDQRNDIVGDFPTLAGKLGYICEYEQEAGQ